jgi:hypothetical protein
MRIAPPLTVSDAEVDRGDEQRVSIRLRLGVVSERRLLRRCRGR